jgi:hypothetical protein
MKTAADMYMEDAHAIGLKAMEAIAKELKEYGVTLTDAQEDQIYLPMIAVIEMLGNCYYRHEH